MEMEMEMEEAEREKMWRTGLDVEKSERDRLAASSLSICSIRSTSRPSRYLVDTDTENASHHSRCCRYMYVCNLLHCKAVFASWED